MIYTSLKISFLSPLVLTHESSNFKPKFIVEETFNVSIEVPLSNGVNLYFHLSIPEGFRTDLASIPRPFWWIPGFSPIGRSEKASILHDYLYWYLHKMLSLQNHFNIHTKKELRQFADDCYYYALLACGENKTIAYTQYRSVRLFGDSSFEY